MITKFLLCTKNILMCCEIELFLKLHSTLNFSQISQYALNVSCKTKFHFAKIRSGSRIIYWTAGNKKTLN